ncbi:hypothetical protein [Thermococcus peptonophilus]|uniref:KaiC-like domain-containing protein n=1 Tax=Thermococcus peptonophilus TaxID=53952 RepID=A0A142CXW4_9EURY|nr:hypothetical protein [Thermococcus peptonophilus]AMQ19616.1 hypothetical protein A0127_10315 [Thermococcus peptonophilus]
MSEPLGILAQAVERISPTLIEFELGSDVEVILMKLLYKLRPNYNDFLIISFYDGYAAFRKYVENIFEEEYVRRVFESAKLLSINSFLEEDFNPLEDLKTSQPDIIAGRALRITEALPQRTLVLVLGLDLYGVRDGEKNLIQLFPRLMTVLNRREGFRTIVTFNTGIFSPSVVNILGSFVFNVVKVGLEVEGKEIRRYIQFIRTPFLEHNLEKWYYTLIGKIVTFRKEE